MADLLQQGDGVVRQADALLRAGGGRAVMLRLAGPAVGGDDAEQLGLATPGFQEVTLGPVVFERANNVNKLLVSASAVQAVVGSLGFNSAEVLFETAVGVVIDDVLYEIVNSFSSQAMGVAYCYWLELKRPER